MISFHFQKYFQSDASGTSVLTVEWTNQHGCGGNENSNPQKQNCVLVLQYACQDDVTDARGRDQCLRFVSQIVVHIYIVKKF